MPPAERTLSQRQLNRALLARQLLLERHDLPAAEAIGRVAGLQSQVPVTPFIGLWTRLVAFDEAELRGLVDSRQIVRATMMRHTIHFVRAEDYRWLRPTIQPALDANFGGHYMFVFPRPLFLRRGLHFSQRFQKRAAPGRG